LDLAGQGKIVEDLTEFGFEGGRQLGLYSYAESHVNPQVLAGLELG
jgi:hypothetical protein